jgi:hypothetical protein
MPVEGSADRSISCSRWGLAGMALWAYSPSLPPDTVEAYADPAMVTAERVKRTTEL